MKGRFEIIQHKITNVVEETLIVTRHLEVGELKWLRNNGIEAFDCVEFNLDTGELKLAVSVINMKIKNGRGN